MPTHNQSPARPPGGRWSAPVLLLLTLLGWSSIPLFLKYFVDSIDAWTANGWRYGFSAVLWAPVLVYIYARRAAPAGLWRAALVPSLLNAAGQVCFGIAPYKIDPGLMTFALRLQIVFVAAGAAILFVPERRIVKAPGFLLGLVLVLGGTCGTVLLKPGGLGTGTTAGVVLAIASGLFYAGYSLSVRRYMHGVNPLVAFAAISQYTAAALVALMLFFGERAGLTVLSLRGDLILLILLSSLIGIGLGHTFYYFSIARLGVAISAGVMQLQPFVVSAASYFLFQEKLTPGQWLSGAAAILGAGLILTTQSRLGRADRRWAEKRAREAADLKQFETLPVDAVAAAAEAERDQDGSRMGAGHAEKSQAGHG